MPPLVTSSLLSGSSHPGAFGAGYRTPSNRSFSFTTAIDMGNLGTLDERMVTHLNKALIFHMEDAARRVISLVRHYLVRLEQAPVKVSIAGTDIHGYDTGVMYVSLHYGLVEHLLAVGVFYDLDADSAPYWRFVEFGHWYQTAQGWKWWEGYHFFETAIDEAQGYIRQRVREAVADTMVKLASEASVPGGRGHVGIRPMSP